MQKCACIVDLINKNTDIQIMYTSPCSPNLLPNEKFWNKAKLSRQKISFNKINELAEHLAKFFSTVNKKTIITNIREIKTDL